MEFWVLPKSTRCHLNWIIVCVCENPIYAAFETVQYILVTILQQAEGGQMGPEKKTCIHANAGV